MKMTEEWTKQQQDEFTALYRKFQQGHDYERYKPAVEKKLFGGGMLPYEDARKILTKFIESQQHESARAGGLEEKIEDESELKNPMQLKASSDFAAYLGALAMILLYIAL